ncbi:hypothetical protein [Streptomyces antibioticus]|uniref:hypothetical protein n=1 Tax=Streptomyces antibioticus TaxID=1890 RepID=UPI003D717489
MFRIVRTATLSALHNDRAELDQTRTDLKSARLEAATVTDSAIRAESTAEDLLRQLGRAHADNIALRREMAAEFEGMRAVLRQATAERDAARAEAEALRARLGTAVPGPRAHDDDRP